MTDHYITLSLLLFTIGAVGVLVRRNAIVVFMCVELMLNATNLAFVTFARAHGNLDGQIAAFLVMVVAAAEVDSTAIEHVASFEPRPSFRLGGGNQRLAIELAGRLGSAVRCGEVVTSVTEHEGCVRVTTSTAEADFDQVVVALPVAVLLAGNITVPLTDAKRSAMRRLTQGHAAKLHLPLLAVPSTSAVLSVPGALAARSAPGGTAPARVREQLDKVRRSIEDGRSWATAN